MNDLTIIINIAIQTDETQGAAEILLNGVNTVVGALANWFQVITTLIPIIENAISGAPDQQTVLDQVRRSVLDVQQLVLAGDAKKDKTDFNLLLTKAKGDLNVLLLSGKHDPMVDESMFFGDVHTAAFVFQDPTTYWARPYLQDLAFYAADFPKNGQPPFANIEGGPSVYDPILAIPAFALAISFFTQVVTIFHADTNDAGTVQPYFTDLADILEREHDRATAGLVTVPVPSLDQLMNAHAFFFDNPLDVAAGLGVEDGQSLRFGDDTYYDPFPVRVGWWHGEIGVVDIYAVFGPSGYPSAMEWAVVYVTPTTNMGNIIDVHPTLRTLLGYFIDAGATDAYRWFRIRMLLGNLARSKALYVAKGYGKVWDLIQKLRRLSGGLPGTPVDGLPAKPVEVTNRNAHWCLSDFDAIIGGWDHDRTYGGGYFSAKYLCAVSPADDTPNYCVRTGASLQITAEGIITRLRAVLVNSTNRPTDPPPQPAYFEPLQRPLSLRKTILAVAF